MGALMGNQKSYVATEALQLLPPGAIGELYLAGDCVSAGYLNDPELKNERFLPNPFRTEQDVASDIFAIIYKTDDLVRYATSGRLEYVGRTDAQVKLRGFRVELGEVNTAISSLPGVKDSTVLARSRDAASSGRVDYLTAYYVSGTADAVRNFLYEWLPSHLVPLEIISTPHNLTVTINGKIDTKRLLETTVDQSQNGKIAPRNRLEAQMCRV
jgi:N-(5-amino-5-carboxypentanoyl)-L-cysteinyl-D-valine synthase